MEDVNKKAKLELLTDNFFDIMRHSSAIVSLYYEDNEYAGYIAEDYLNEHPEFSIPPMKNGIYVFDEVLYKNLNEYCDKKCTEFGYDDDSWDDYDDERWEEE